MNIGEVAKQVGLTEKTIRFYESKGLITLPKRAENGYRFYQAEQLQQLQLLKQARNIGFSLLECQQLLQLFADPQRHSADVKAAAERKLQAIEQQLIDLQRIKQQLTTLIAQCPGNQQADCPIMQRLLNG